jgi:hypothetical protein
MSKMNMTLEDFLTLYEKEKGGSSPSYARWMAQNGYAPEQDLDAAIKDAYRTYDRGGAEYGVTAEKLGQMHLADSGYSDYLDQAAKDRFGTDMRRAQEDYQETLGKASRGYETYLRQTGARTKSVIRALDTQGVTDYDTAYAYGLISGLTSESAKIAATYVETMTDRGASQTVIRQRMSLLSQMIRLSLPKDVAYSYALSCGVTEEVAKELSEAAYKAQYPYAGDKIVY